jgi:hypothetical protein
MRIDTSRQTLRLTLGTTLAFGTGQLLGWRMAFIVPLLAVALLKSPRCPTPGAGLGFFLVIAITFTFALVVVLPLLNYPSVAMAFLVLALFWAFFLGQRGSSHFVVLMLLLALTMVPVLGLVSVDLSVEIAKDLARSGLLAVLFTWLAFALVPANPSSSQSLGATKEHVSNSAREVRMAWVSTLVVSPLLIVFLNFGLSSFMLVLVFVTLLAIQPELSTGVKGGMVLIAGNMLGGGIALLVYELVVILPDLFFLSLLIALVCLLLGRRIFEGGTAGAICGTALTTVLLIIGMTVSPIGPEADAEFISRIVQVSAAAFYVVGAFALAGTLIKRADSPSRLVRNTG